MIERITFARQEELSEIYEFYREVCAELVNAQYTPRWEIDLYPTKEDIKKYILKQEMVIGWCEERIFSAMVLADHDHYTSLHLFAVHPKYRGKHISEEMMQAMYRIVEKRGHKIIRLDVIRGNLPAERLYQKIGFRKIGTRAEYFDFCGELTFSIYESVL